MNPVRDKERFNMYKMRSLNNGLKLSVLLKFNGNAKRVSYL